MSDALAVLDAAGSERAAVFASRGPSMEGILLAATHPERVSHLIVVSGQARTAYASDYPMGVPQSLLDEFLATNTEPDAVDRGFDLLALVAPTVSRDNAFRRWWDRAGNRAASPAMARAILEVVLRSDVRHVLPLIRVPTLVMHRRDDRFVLADHGRYLAEHFLGPDLWTFRALTVSLGSVRQRRCSTRSRSS